MMMWFSVVLLAQRIFVQKIATDFHKVAYRERIKESKKCLKILEKLKKSMARSGLAGLFDTDPNANTFDDDTDYDMSDRDNVPKSASFFQKIFKKKEKEEVVIELEAPIPSPVQRSNSNPNRQASTRKRELPREESSNKSFVPFLSIGTRKKKPGWTSHLSSDQYAFELSQKLFRSLHDSQTGLIYLTNLDKYFDTPEQAAEAFGLFDKDGNGSITISELRWTIVKIYREKRHLQESMIDLSHALGNLNQILYVISLLTAVLLSLPIYGISINAVLPFTSILVALSFIFGGSAKSTFDCIVFLFVTHPFDTGDRVLIDDKAYIVEEMSILNTLFIMDGKRTYFPNSNYD
jgi:hypothetical protein